MVPTGSFCRTSSSFRDLPSEESWAGAQGLLGLRPRPPGSPGAAQQTAVLTGVQAEGLAGGVPLWVCRESGVSRHTAWWAPLGPGVAPGHGPEAQAKRDVVLPEALQGRSCRWPHGGGGPRPDPRSLGHTRGISAGP